MKHPSISPKHIPIKYLQPIESIYVKLQDGTDFHWFFNRFGIKQPEDLQIEWIDGKPCKVSVSHKEEV